MTRADHLALVTARIEAARARIAAEEREERNAEAKARRAVAPKAAAPWRRCACGCARRAATRSRYSSDTCQVRASRERHKRPLVERFCACGCGEAFLTRHSRKRFVSATHQYRDRDRRRYQRDPRRREPRGVNRARALARVGGAA